MCTSKLPGIVDVGASPEPNCKFAIDIDILSWNWNNLNLEIPGTVLYTVPVFILLPLTTTVPGNNNTEYNTGTYYTTPMIRD